MKKQKEKFGRRCKEKMMITKIRRNTSALSPIFAVLILIAIAVIAGIVVYMFTSGTIASLTGGGTAGQEKAAVQGVDVALDTVYAQNTGGVTIEVSDYVIKDAGGTIVASGTAGGVTTLDVNGGLEGITCGGDILALATSNPGESFTVTLVSTKGGSFVSSSFVP
jgi:flagellin-like protein